MTGSNRAEAAGEIPRHQTPINRFHLRWLVLGLTAWSLAGPASALSPDIVLAEIYGGGGNPGASYTHDYVVLFNRGGSSASINNWSIQYAAAAGATWQVTTLPNVSIPPGSYYMIQEASSGAVGAELPPPDASIVVNPINLSGT